jgi:hypothetical protein
LAAKLCCHGLHAIANTKYWHTKVKDGFANVQKHYYGLQFHPEVTHTKQGKHILERFVAGICDCQKKWTTDNIIAYWQLVEIRLAMY